MSARAAILGCLSDPYTRDRAAVTWLKLDDGFWSHPKIVGRTDGAFRLHVCAMGYCARHSTDGHVPAAALPTLYPRNQRAHALELVAAGVWHDEHHDCPSCPPVAPATFYVHDFLAYNPSAELGETEAAKRSEKASRAARARWAKHSASSNAQALPEQSSEHMLGDAPSRPVVITNSSTYSVTGAGLSSDDEERFARTIDRLTAKRINGVDQATINDLTRYTAKVRHGVLEEHADRLCELLHRHPAGTVDQLAGALLGEPTSLGR